MADDMTCGKGLAEHSVIPAKIGELIEALAENLELHMPALVLTDVAALEELSAYATLAAEYRAIAAQLTAAAERMAGYRDLPMGEHDAKAMQDRKVLDGFVRFVNLERELVTMLQASIKRDEQLLTR